MENDPLLYQTPFPYRRTFYPFGFAATVTTNCEQIIVAAEESWGRFEQTRTEPPVEMRLAVSDSGASERPAPMMPRGQGHLIATVHDASNFLICDLRSGFAFGWLTPAVACDRSYCRYYFLENYVTLLLQGLYLTPAHAACVALHDQGVLLLGQSEAGKTTLSYACARRGWTYVSDDGLNLVRKSCDRVVVGNPHQIRFRPHAKVLFPELSEYVPAERPNGKPNLELDTAELNIAVAPEARAEHLVFLNRNPSGPQRIAKFDKDEAYDRLAWTICCGEDSLREEQRASLRRLLGVPLYEMQYYDLEWAEQRLRSLVENGG